MEVERTDATHRIDSEDLALGRFGLNDPSQHQLERLGREIVPPRSNCPWETTDRSTKGMAHQMHKYFPAPLIDSTPPPLLPFIDYALRKGANGCKGETPNDST